MLKTTGFKITRRLRMKSMVDLYIVRHGETDSNVKKINGAHSEALNENGRIQAQRLFESQKLPQNAVIYSSPLARTIETAKIATGRHFSEFIQSDLLVERSFGIWAGKPWREIANRLKGDIYRLTPLSFF